MAQKTSSTPGSGAKLQLAALGAQNTFLLGKVSHFKHAFKRAARFDSWTEEIAVEYAPDARVQADIPRAGDLLGECTLLVNLPAVPGGGTWPANIGYLLFRRIRLVVGGVDVHNTERLWYDLYDKLHTRAGHARGLDAMVGRTPLSKTKAHELYVPLRFLTCGKGRLRAPLPLCALRDPPVVDIDWESLDTLGLSDPGISAKLLVEYVELDEPERREYLHPVSMAFDTVMDSDAQSYFVDADGLLRDVTKIRVNLGNVRFPVKLVAFVSYVDGTFFQYLDNTLDKINITFNNLDRFAPRSLSYFETIQRYAHCRRSDASGPPGVYSFALDATARKDTGAAQFGALKRVALEATVIAPQPRFKVKVFSLYTNVLKIGSGSASLAFS